MIKKIGARFVAYVALILFVVSLVISAWLALALNLWWFSAAAFWLMCIIMTGVALRDEEPKDRTPPLRNRYGS